MTAAELQQHLAQPYDRARWLETLRQILPQTEVFAEPQAVLAENARVESIVQLGKARLANTRQLALLETTVDDRIDLVRNRVGLRNIVARYIDQADYHGILAIFHQRNAKDYRFTFAAREAALDDSGQLVRTETVPRRYTYLLGPNESCRTAAERFDLLARRGERAELNDLVEAFNVEKLNREFFADFRKAFDVVVKDILVRNQGWERAVAERETQTLLSRLLFLYFIQRKGWLSRQRDYLISAFNRFQADDANGTSFNDKFLKPFFVKLSVEDAFFPNLDLGDLPFLNGGLFDDEIGSLTGRGRMRVGNTAFRHVFDRLLEAYNFTVREDTPLDQEVAIDPEMLGKIFESLVLQLEQSDTGGKTSRHDTGSYYTPRPIVHYLCREGLRVWLEQFPPGKSADWPARLEKLFTLDAADGIGDAERIALNDLLTPDEARALDDRLDGFRACDPAVGSGAFLVGLLHELVNLHRLCETRARGKDPATDIEWLYETKKRIIENVLYGVDIQQRAVEICKLRLWISLMVDYPLEVDPDNCALPDFRRALKKITPLPNLDFKIRRANSLIEQIRGHAIKFPQTATDSREFALSLNKLATAKHRFYEARLKKEKRLAQLDALDATAELAKYEFNAAKLKYGLLPSDQDADRMADLAAAEAEMGRLQMQIAVARKKNEREKDDEIERLSRVFNDEAKPTFVWQLDFAEIFHRPAADAARSDSLLLDGKTKPANGKMQASGFDLVLANPPYVRMELFKNIKPALINSFPLVHDERADLYCYFYGRAIEILCDGGALAFISSNEWFRAKYGAPLRKFIAKSCHIRSITDFGELPVFENAATFPMIFVAEKGEQKKDGTVFTRVQSLAAPYPDMPALVRQLGQTLPSSAIKESSWMLTGSASAAFARKLEKSGMPLGDYVKGHLFYGVKTGFNEAFVIDASQREMLLKESPKSGEVIKPLLLGDDIRKWRVARYDKWLLYMYHGIDVKGLDAVLDHLRRFKSELEERATEQNWYELQQPQLRYASGFEKPKIIFPDIAKESRFTFDKKGAYLGNTAYAIPLNDFYLLAVLNSTCVWQYAKATFACLGDPEQGGRFRFIYQFVTKIPIPVTPAPERETIEKLVEQCLAARGENCEAWEAEINERVCRLYHLTPDEIKLVQEACQ